MHLVDWEYMKLLNDGKTSEICYRWNGIIFHLTLLTQLGQNALKDISMELPFCANNIVLPTNHHSTKPTILNPHHELHPLSTNYQIHTCGQNLKLHLQYVKYVNQSRQVCSKNWDAFLHQKHEQLLNLPCLQLLANYQRAIDLLQECAFFLSFQVP